MILAAIAALAFTSVADAKSCKDASGKFIKCPSAVAAQTTAKAMSAADKQAAKANEKAAKKDAAIAKAASKKATSAASKASTDAGQAMAAAPVATSGRKAPHCTKGKACGNSCIKMSDVCHK
jgi:hypothetical protein